jgi:hypothetical protein
MFIDVLQINGFWGFESTKHLLHSHHPQGGMDPLGRMVTVTVCTEAWYTDPFHINATFRPKDGCVMKKWTGKSKEGEMADGLLLLLLFFHF